MARGSDLLVRRGVDKERVNRAPGTERGQKCQKLLGSLVCKEKIRDVTIAGWGAFCIGTVAVYLIFWVAGFFWVLFRAWFLPGGGFCFFFVAFIWGSLGSCCLGRRGRLGFTRGSVSLFSFFVSLWWVFPQTTPSQTSSIASGASEQPKRFIPSPISRGICLERV